ncbi:MAG: leucyl aminopeptidase family protein [Alphaproteobacteria bacterium]|nr:leucyl aminopeptidase family protein [Alphaproteobacteria bacterium]MCB9974903.1 leucyl aminopeptidase family protein [Rhodospirillales bacterium]
MLSAWFAEKKHPSHITITCVREKNFTKWLKDQPEEIRTIAKENGFEGKKSQYLVIRGKGAKASRIFMSLEKTARYADGSELCAFVARRFGLSLLKKVTFEISSTGLTKSELERLAIGWGLEHYRFDSYKMTKDEKKPVLFLDKNTDHHRIRTLVEATFLTRTLINTPANDLGPDELEAAARKLATTHKAKFTAIRDDDLNTKNFPLIYTVGKGSSRRPRLIDIRWGKSSDPAVTLVGKGVCFDTGGLDLKPSKAMLTMKKDMGGAAHALGAASAIMALDLPVYLRVLIPAVENSVSGESFRPMDIIKSRKGLSVEIGNTDAEGRLVLADALTYACEDKKNPPELIVDLATLTGAARVALGADLPALFSNHDKTLDEIKTLSQSEEIDDPVWPLPLWDDYRKDLNTDSADISSTGAGMAGAITAALFLREFVDRKREWVHLDLYAWELSGKPGRPKGGADTGLRTLIGFIEKRYGKAKPQKKKTTRKKAN